MNITRLTDERLVYLIEANYITPDMQSLALEVQESRKHIVDLEAKLKAIASINPEANYLSNANRNAGWRDVVRLVRAVIDDTPIVTLHSRCDLISGLDYTCAYCDAIDKIKPILDGAS